MKRKRAGGAPGPAVDQATLAPCLVAGPGRDLFAEIAAQRQGDTAWHDPAEPQAPPPPERLLQGRHDANARFRPAPKIDTPAKLTRVLERYRRRYAPFLHDHAPQLESPRWRLRIDTFDWRLETEEDRRAFAGTLAGRGVWEPVSIPHYGGPLGRATAYYRAVFHVPADAAEDGAHYFVVFDGVDYRAGVFVNGYPVGTHEGFFAPFVCDASKAVRPGDNVLLVKVENDAICLGNDSWDDDHDGDKLYAATGCGYDDPEVGWHHCPPGMGIYQPVHIERRSRVHIHDVFVRPVLEERRAEVWIEVYNATPGRHPVTAEYAVYGGNFRKTVVPPRRYVPPGPMGPTFNYLRIPFDIPSPRVWDGDTPWIYACQVRLLDASGRVADTAQCTFGMRSFRQDETRVPKGRFLLNGREIRLRGANEMGFVQQCAMREDAGRLCDAILLAKIAHMNFLRLTQRPVQRAVYDYCDRLGLMTQTDLPLFGCLRRNQFCEAVRQAEEMERLVRAHPCNVLVSYINEPAPSFGGGGYRQLTRPELEAFFEAADRAVRIANPDRVVKAVDGDYDPPAPGLPDNHCYCGWYNGHGLDLGRLHRGYWQHTKPGWFHGCGEFGSEGLDPVALMRARYPKEWLPGPAGEEAGWTPGRIVKAQTGRFHYMWFDTQTTLEGWVRASQAHQAWITRIMTEAFRRDTRMNTCAIHLFIDAFPAGWMKAIMDCTMTPKPAYFAYREALTPLAVNIRAGRYHWWSGEAVEAEAWICNDRVDTPKAALHCQIEMDGRVVFARRYPVRVPACGSACQGRIRFQAPPAATRRALTLRLGLIGAEGRVLHDTSAAFEVFPAPLPLETTVGVIGPRGGLAHRLALGVGCKVRFGFDAGCLLIDPGVACDARLLKQAGAAVRAGCTATYVEWPAGRHRIAGDTIDIEPCGMGARHFVSRQTGHPLVRDFLPDDFRFWYDEKADCVTPLLATLFTAPASWKPVLTTGQGGWGNEEWRPALAVAEKPYGKGVVRLCQLRLAGRLQSNPVARQLACRLLEAVPHRDPC